LHRPSPYGEVCTKRPRSDISLYILSKQVNKKFIINFFINRTRGLYREISDGGLFCTDPACRARFVQKDRGLIFLCTYRASEVNKKFII
jgi:hypothetical protein